MQHCLWCEKKRRPKVGWHALFWRKKS
jgi:hypothetical protein